MNSQSLESILDLADALSRQTSFDEILRLTVKKASVLFRSENVLILMVNPTTQETIKTVYKQGSKTSESQFQLLHTYLTGWVLESNRSLISRDLKNDRRFRQELVSRVSVHSALCGPFRSEGKILGSLLILDPVIERNHDQEILSLLDRFSGVVSPFLRNVQKLQHYFEPVFPESALIRKYEAFGLKGKSPPYVSMLHAVESAAKSDVRVLLEGETGTGKELIAKAIHKGSERAGQKFVAIDCGAIPRDLIESELFGHVKGAFTGAMDSRKGLLEEAHQGSLFMDEITNLPMDMQSRLLRVLQENEVRPLGSNISRKVDVRIIAASSKSLREHVEEGFFREDLFYRLYVYPVEIPPLHLRRDDIPILAGHFLKKFSGQQKKKIHSFSPEILQLLMNYPWPGNIRELENQVERMVTLASRETEVIDPGLLPTEFSGEKVPPDPDVPSGDSPQPLRDRLARYEKEVVENALERSGWNQSRAARELAMSEHAIRYKIKKLGITRNQG